MRFETKAIHAGQGPDPATGATIVPIYQTSTFTQEEIGRHKGYEYSRTENPTRAALEKCVAALEGGEYGLAFASGMAAEAAVASILTPGDHVLVSEDLYGGTYRMFERVHRPLGIEFDYVDGKDPQAFRNAAKDNTRLVWLESPTNPLLRIIDIEAVAGLFKGTGIFVAVDNTFATPYLQNPLALGADIAVHSTTKYIAGHSDVVGGAVATSNRDIYEAVRLYQNAAGGIPGPFDCWLTLRGIKTLAVRMRQHCANAMRVAEYLSGHAKVERVIYPGLPGHPQHLLAKRLMRGFGGMVTFDIKGGRDEANAFFKRLRIFSYAASLGGVESLACYPAVMSHGSLPKEERERRGIFDGTVRLSVGIEDSEDLIEDLGQALG